MLIQNAHKSEAHSVHDEKGFNSDVMFRGLNFHVQTEDWGQENPYLVSRIYQNGAVVRSWKTPYSDLFRGRGFGMTEPAFRLALRTAMERQHQQILDLLVSGQLL